jgi:hypothetical protein
MKHAPQSVDDIFLAFPGDVRHLMPSREECEDALRAIGKQGREWRGFQSRWFFEGVDVSGMKPRKGVDKEKALRHLGAIQGSFEPKHEHKEAAVAYLASLWFTKPPRAERGRS